MQKKNKNLFNDIKETSFSISNIWNKQLDSKNLHGYESKEAFVAAFEEMMDISGTKINVIEDML